MTRVWNGFIVFAATALMGPGWAEGLDSAEAESSAYSGVFATSFWDGVFVLADSLADAPNPKGTKTRAALSLDNAGGRVAEPRFRHRTESDRWTSFLELRGDSLRRAQWGLRDRGWRLALGNVEDTAMPLRPRWLGRRTLPRGWAGRDAWVPGFSRAPLLAAAGVEAGTARAYALRAEARLRAPDSPPWEPSWALRHFAGGAEWLRPWNASFNFSESRISRGDADTLSEHLLALGFAAPGRRVALDWAWNGSTRRFRGGQALGLRAFYPLGAGGLGEIVFRNRGPDWNSVWDSAGASRPGYLDETDTAEEEFGSAEMRLRLRLPLTASTHPSFAEGEGWNSWGWNEGRRAGFRGRVVLRGRGVLLEARGAQVESFAASGPIQRPTLGFRLQAGESPKWEMRFRRAWQGTVREEEAIACHWRWGKARFRPGISGWKNGGDSVFAAAFSGARLPVSAGWDLDCAASLPLNGPGWRGAEWKIALLYSARQRESSQRVSP